MSSNLLKMVIEKNHYRYRKECPIEFAEVFSAQKLEPKERMTQRFERMCELETPVILEEEKICYLRTISNIPECFTKEELAELKEEYYVHYINNICPNYEKAIKDGLLALREGADAYGKRAIDAIIGLSDRYRAEALRKGRKDIAKVLERVPRYGATSFREALQMFRILHFSIWLEGGKHVTIGRFDQYMFPFLKADLDKGILTEESALELLEDFFISFNKDSDLYPGVQKGDNGQSMMLGGINEQGEDVYNLLSELCLKASYNNKMIDPKINLRVSKNTPMERFAEATKLTKVGLGFPQYSNDDVVIPALEKLGYEYQDAVNYTVAACWEFIIPGVGNEIVNVDAMSYPEAVDRALHENLTDCETFEEFFKAVKKNIEAQSEKICNSIQKMWTIPYPFMNVMMDCEIYDCKGKYSNFGIHGAGIATAADSLAAIKKYVYEEKSIGKTQLIQAVDSNFENDPELLHLLRYEAPKLGNNDDYVDSIAVDLLDSFAVSLEGKRNCLGGRWRAGTGTAMFYLWKANEIGASPDGRRRGEPLGTNFSVSLFAKVKGPVSVIGSMTKPHFEDAINGGPLTLEFHQSVFANQEGIEKVAQLVKRFVDLGGHQLQLNAVNPERLLDAQQHPENYRQLVVRIWGWSAYFVELDKEYQDHVIARQVYSV